MKTIFIIAAALAAPVFLAHAQPNLTADERNEIQSLAARYAEALGSCDAAGFAGLFEPKSGSFASGFRGNLVGHDRLVALVESERHCQAANPNGAAGRPGGRSVPTVVLEPRSDGVFGVVDLGAVGQYQDEYVRTPAGWRFAARTVVIAAERAAGLDAENMAAIRALSADLPAVDHYSAEENGVKRFLSSGVVIRVEDGKVRGRVYLDDGGYYDDVYERTASGAWRIQSRERVAAAAN